VADVGILIHQKFQNIIHEIEHVKNIIRIMIKHWENIFCKHICPGYKLKEKREIFFEELQDTVNKLSNNKNIFIIDDFNSRIDS